MLFVIASLIVTHLVIPAVLMISLWRSKFPSKLNWSISPCLPKRRKSWRGIIAEFQAESHTIPDRAA